MNTPSRINIYGTRFSETYTEETLELIRNYNFSKPGYVCFPSTNIVSKAYFNKEFQSILNNAFLTIPDGKITEVYGRVKGSKKIRTISGFNLLVPLLKSKLTHYFYGTTERNLALMRERIEREFPEANVLGYKSPPFVDKSEIASNAVIAADITEINRLKPDLIWIGISNIKQDYLMHHYIGQLNQGLMLGVGAVFLYFTGQVKRGPLWLKKLGLRWVYRLIQEPRKEFKKTVPSTIFFLLLVCIEILMSPFAGFKKLVGR